VELEVVNKPSLTARKSIVSIVSKKEFGKEPLGEVSLVSCCQEEA
jgi:hypothetical protein